MFILKAETFSIVYRPRTKFAKVMFSQVSVCPRGWRGVCHTPRADNPSSLGRQHPGQTPPGQTPPCADTPWAETPQTDTPFGQTPPGKHTHQEAHPLGSTPPESTAPTGKHPPGNTPPSLVQSCWDMVNKRAAPIPLECIPILPVFKVFICSLNILIRYESPSE